jgi:hypothetical protein
LGWVISTGVDNEAEYKHILVEVVPGPGTKRRGKLNYTSVEMDIDHG